VNVETDGARMTTPDDFEDAGEDAVGKRPFTLVLDIALGDRDQHDSRVGRWVSGPQTHVPVVRGEVDDLEQAESPKAENPERSEERRVGKEGRCRWAPEQ